MQNEKRAPSRGMRSNFVVQLIVPFQLSLSPCPVLDQRQTPHQV